MICRQPKSRLFPMIGARALRALPSTIFCAGTGLGERDTCSGDSGGPLVVGLGSGAARLVGSTSFGLNGDCGSATAASGYAELAAEPLRSSIERAVLDMTGVGPGHRHRRHPAFDHDSKSGARERVDLCGRQLRELAFVPQFIRRAVHWHRGQLPLLGARVRSVTPPARQLSALGHHQLIDWLYLADAAWQMALPVETSMKTPYEANRGMSKQHVACL